MFTKVLRLRGKIPVAGFKIVTGKSLGIVLGQPEIDPIVSRPGTQPVNRNVSDALPDGTAGGSTKVPALVLIRNTDAGTSPVNREVALTLASGTDFLTFSILTRERPNAVLELANRYGFLGSGQSYPVTGGGRVHGESLEDWFTRAGEMRVAVHIWRLVVARDTETLGNLLKWVDLEAGFPVDGRSGKGWRLTPPNSKPRWIEGERMDEPDAVALTWLRCLANAHIAGPVHPQIISSENGNVLGLQPLTTLPAFWLQFAYAVTGEQEYRECAGCGKPFAVDKHDGNNVRRVTCSGACRTKLSRTRPRGRPTPLGKTTKPVHVDGETTKRRNVKATKKGKK